jgi:hypothetical protein
VALDGKHVAQEEHHVLDGCLIDRHGDPPWETDRHIEGLRANEVGS